MVRFSALLVTLITLLMPEPAAASYSISLDLSRERVRVGESLELKAEVRGPSGNLPALIVPEIKDFRVSNIGRQRSISVSGSRVTAKEVYKFILIPGVGGEFIIPPFKIETPSGDVYSESLRVTADLRKPPGGEGPPEMFIEQETDRSEVYTGEQFKYIFRFFSSRSISGEPDIEKPCFRYFSINNPRTRNYNEIREGERYNIIEFSYPVYPNTPGERRIGIGGISARVEGEKETGLFGMTFPVTRRVSVESEPLVVKVLPLPPGAPEAFTGAAGTCSISSRVEEKIISGEKFIMYSVLLSGDVYPGNMRIPEFENRDFRLYDLSVSVQTDTAGDRVITKKEFKHLLIPSGSGGKISPVIFNYFDTEKREYLSVKTGGHIIGDYNAAERPADTPGEALRPLASAPGRMPPLPLASGRVFIYLNAGLGILWILTFSLGILRTRKEKLGEEIIGKRIRARALLRRGRKAAAKGDAAGVYESIDSLCRLLDINESSEIIDRARKCVYSPDPGRKPEKLKEDMESIGKAAKRILKILFLLIIFSAPLRGAGFNEATELIAAGEWEEGIMAMESILEEEGDLSGVLYNLGNAYWHTGDKGMARYSWERALNIDPLNRDIRRNISLLLSSIPEADARTPMSQVSHFFATPSGRNLLTGYLFISGWSFLFLMQLRLFKRKACSSLRLLTVLMLFAGGLLFRYYIDRVPEAAVLLRPSVLLNAPDADAGVISEIYPGVRIGLIENKENYILIEYHSGEGLKRGWAEADKFKRI